jgi:signal transduction histidine kinase
MLSEVSLDVCSEENPELRENITAIRMQAKNGLFDTRRALRELRSTDAEMPRGIPAIRNLLITYSRATEIEARLELLVRSDLLEDSPLFLTVFRFVQEALTNTFRHGRSTRVVVRFQRSENWLIVSVVDDGRGAAVVTEGIGLQGMRERVEALGGELTYNGVNGFTVAARLPIQETP